MAKSLKWIPYQSWFVINLNGIIIHIDPTLYKSWEGAEKEVTEKADIILITHAHADHCAPELIEKIKKADTLIYAAECCKVKLKKTASYLKSGEEIEFKGVRIKTVQAYNIGKNYHPKGYGVGYLIIYEGKTIYHAGDTDIIPEMAELGQVDIALLPIGGTYTMTMEEAAKAASVIKPAILIPMHKLDSQPEKLKEFMGDTIKVIVLKPGDIYPF